MAGQFRDWVRAIGAPEDPVATDTTSSWSLISLWKAIFGKINDGTLAAGIAASAGSAIQSASAGSIARADLAAKRVRSVSSATLALTAGYALLGQRTKKDRAAAAASAAAAAASAASVPTAEQLVLPIQVYS